MALSRRIPLNQQFSTFSRSSEDFYQSCALVFSPESFGVAHVLFVSSLPGFGWCFFCFSFFFFPESGPGWPGVARGSERGRKERGGQKPKFPSQRFIPDWSPGGCVLSHVSTRRGSNAPIQATTWLSLGNILHFCLSWFGGKSQLSC